MAYITTNDVYRTSGLTNSVISETDIASHIKTAESTICRLTKNIYWNTELDNQRVDSADTDYIVSENTEMEEDAYKNMYVYIYSGDSAEQIRKIISNENDTIYVDREFSPVPSSGDKFRIFYVPEGFDPYIEGVYDGNNNDTFCLPFYPVNLIESLTIQGTSISVSTGIYIYKKTGIIKLKSGSEYAIFSSRPPQGILVNYWYGVPYLPYEIKRLCELKSAIQIMSQQMGGTYDDPSNISLPEVNITIGQAYINIKSSLDTLQREYDDLIKSVIKIYPVFG